MKAYLITRDGNILIQEGGEDFWMDPDVTYAETETPEFPGHTLFYDDESMKDPGEVRVVIGGVEVPLPAWFMGVNGEDTKSPSIEPEELKKSIKLP